MNKKQISFRVPVDTHDQFEEYRGEEVSKSDAARRIFEAGLKAETKEEETPSNNPVLLYALVVAGGAVTALFWGWVQLAAGDIQISTYVTLSAVVLAVNVAIAIGVRRGVFG